MVQWAVPHKFVGYGEPAAAAAMVMVVGEGVVVGGRRPLTGYRILFCFGEFLRVRIV